MAIKRKDIREILGNEGLDSEGKEKALLDLFHNEADELRDANDKLSSELEKAKKDADSAIKAKEKSEEALESYKTEQASKETRSSKESAYRKLLEEVGVSDKRISRILKVTDIDSLELNKDGSIKDIEKHKSEIESEWAEFIPEQETKGASVSTPPAKAGAKLTKSEIMKIKDTSERQQAIIDNHELFGI